jgi:hypothetical protein
VSDGASADDSVNVPGETRHDGDEGRVLMDFTVGPAGVGPPTAITPVDADEDRPVLRSPE